MTIQQALVLPILLLSSSIGHVDSRRRLTQEEHSVDDDDDDYAESATVALGLRHVQHNRRVEASGDNRKRKLQSKSEWCKFTTKYTPCFFFYTFSSLYLCHTSYLTPLAIFFSYRFNFIHVMNITYMQHIIQM